MESKKRGKRKDKKVFAWLNIWEFEKNRELLVVKRDILFFLWELHVRKMVVEVYNQAKLICILRFDTTWVIGPRKLPF